MQDWWKSAKETLVVAACVLVCAIIVGFFLIPEMREADRWIGKDAGWLPVIGGLATVTAAATAAVFAGLTYRATRQEARDAYRAQRSEAIDTRFQKAVELLGSENSITAIGGVYALRDIINIDPDRYYLGGLQLLCDFIGDRCRPDFADFEKAEIAYIRGEKVQFAPRTTPPDVLTALNQFGKLRTDDRVAKFEAPTRRRMHAFDIETLVVNHVQIGDLNLSRLRVQRLVVQEAFIHGCFFSGSHIVVAIANFGSGHPSTLTFSHCAIQEAYLRIPRGPLTGERSGLVMANCDLTFGTVDAEIATTITASCVERASVQDGATLSECWHLGHPPSSSDGYDVFDATGFNTEHRSVTGMPVYNRY